MVLELPLLGDLITKAARFLYSVLVASVVAVLWRKICGLLVHLLRIRAQQGCFPLWMTSLSLYIYSTFIHHRHRVGGPREKMIVLLFVLGCV